MTTLLSLPLEIRNDIYDLLLNSPLQPNFRGVMVVSQFYVQRHLPVLTYHGLLSTCRQLHREAKLFVAHLVASQQLIYGLRITFSHGRPFWSLSWTEFPGLSPTINHLHIDIALRTDEPYHDGEHGSFPREHELSHLIASSPKSFAGQLFDYIAILLKTLASLLAAGDLDFNVLYVEVMTLNLLTPWSAVPGPANAQRQTYRMVPMQREEASSVLGTMQNTLKATSKGFRGFNAQNCDTLFPLIQIGNLRFATEGEVWAEGHNLVLAHDDFQWLKY